jgi:predicted CxxxxCH...CXXCH cytochrome family protein
METTTSSPNTVASPQPQPLLTKAGVEGSYVLVVHSISGKTARLFASQHPSEVAGMVLIDARHESVDEYLTPEQIAAEGAHQRRFQNMIGWMAKFGLVRLLWAPAWPRVLPGSENLSAETRTAIGVLQAAQQIVNALAEGQGRMESDTQLRAATAPLATRHSSSWRQHRASITCHSGRRRNRSWPGYRRTVAWSSPRAVTPFISSSPRWWRRAFARSSMPRGQVSR